MGFTAKALLPPVAVFFLLAWFTRADLHATAAGALGTLILLWGFVALCVVLLYWAARIYQHWTRDWPDHNGHR